eukprot:TRINITY_DN13524_c0_g1_i3.p1 TRINITY_DN13524_c0_g1~~TRINITY_DN13524_c0_g1_i3.p1  ORF type:complete len:816 (-),score=214.97 TRINITY_DN13524_c0_g1_i3:194-2641(-)
MSQFAPPSSFGSSQPKSRPPPFGPNSFQPAQLPAPSRPGSKFSGRAGSKFSDGPAPDDTRGTRSSRFEDRHGKKSRFEDQQYGGGHSKKSEESYWDDDDEEEEQPPVPVHAAAVEEEDPLDAFMSGIDTEVKKDQASQMTQQVPQEVEEEEDPLDAFMSGVSNQISKPAPEPVKATRCDESDEDDAMMSYLKARKAKAAKILLAEAAKDSGSKIGAKFKLKQDDEDGRDSDDEVYEAARALESQIVYDENDMPILKDQKEIEPLPPVDHDSIQYYDFRKNFYREDPEIAKMGANELKILQKQLEIKVSGFDCPNPVHTFEQLRLSKILMGAIAKHGYTKPTPIQAQAIPIIMKGMDVIGLAKTGSGKTAAFVLPMVPHVMDQPELRKGDGPICIILAPTRELAHQIYVETKKFTKNYRLGVQAVYGGMNKMAQFKGIRKGAEVVIGTPGRVIDMCKMKGGLTLQRVTYFVLDEADRMFDLGFEPQVRSIANNVRPDRQTVLFSATMERRIERLVKDIMKDAVRITAGSVGAANKDIKQVVVCLDSDADKWGWLAPRIQELSTTGSMIIFVSTKNGCEQLASSLNQYAGVRAASLHGDKSQEERDEVINAFRSSVLTTVVATDVAARGLDIKWIKTVVNFDCARDIDSHVHRIGRTGRAGDKEGVAYTLMTRKEYRMAPALVQCLEQAGQVVPPELVLLSDLAGGVPRSKRGAGPPGGRGAGLGFGGGGHENKAQKSAAEWNQRLAEHANLSNTGRNKEKIVLGDRHHSMSQFKSAGVEGTVYRPPTQKSAALPVGVLPGAAPQDGSKKRKSRWGA